MDLPLLVVIVLVTAAALAAGVTFTLRGFRATPARATGAEGDGAANSRYDHPTTDLLKRFFDGKECAICKQPIPPVNRTGVKPGLLNPVTHEARSWDEIPNANLPAALENQLPVCSGCLVAQSFRQRFPDLVVDRDRTLRDAHSHGTGS